VTLLIKGTRADGSGLVPGVVVLGVVVPGVVVPGVVPGVVATGAPVSGLIVAGIVFPVPGSYVRLVPSGWT
jgi:hypothetical protein